MKLLLLAAAAHADTFKVPDDYTFAEAVEAAYKNAGTDTIDVDSAYDGSSEDPVELRDQELEIKGNGATIPALSAVNVSLKLTDATIRTMTTFWPDASIDIFDCALCLAESSVDVQGLTVIGDEAGDAVVLVDTDASIRDLEVRDLWDDGSSHAQGSGLAVKGILLTPTVAVTESTFTRTQGAALTVQGTVAVQPVDLHSVTIDSCGASALGAIALMTADLTMDDSGSGDSKVVNSGSSAGSTTTIYVFDSTFTASGTTFTGNGGTSASLFTGNRASVSLDSCTLSSNSSSSGVEIQAEDVQLHGVTWTPHGSLKTSSRVEVTGSSIDLTDTSGTTFTKWVDSSDGPVTLRDNTICGSGLADRQTQALVSAQSGVAGGSLVFTGNVVTQGAALAGALFVLDTSSVEFHDNTIVDSRGSNNTLFSGNTLTFYYENNLVSGGDAGVSLDSVPTGISDYNLHANTIGAWTGLPAGSDKNSHLSSGLGDAPPGFVGTFDSTLCGSMPELDSTSWAINHGDPTFLDADGSRSDIGALDYGGIIDTGDTGDTGTVDTGDTGTVDTGDTGAVDSGGDTSPEDTAAPDEDGDGYAADDCDDHDSGVHPGALDEPGDGWDQDCSGGDADVTWAGGCGCDSGAKLPGGLGLLLVLGLMRRRAG